MRWFLSPAELQISLGFLLVNSQLWLMNGSQSEQELLRCGTGEAFPMFFGIHTF